MNLIEPKVEGYYLRDHLIFRQDGGDYIGWLPLIGIGASTVWIAPVFLPFSLAALILMLVPLAFIVGGVKQARNYRGAVVARKEIPVMPVVTNPTDEMIEHPKVQEAIRDYEADTNKNRNYHSHWVPTFEKLFEAVKENIALTSEQTKELLPSDYHIDVEVHNEMIKPRALEMPVEEKPEPKKPVDPKSLGVNFHIRYNELEILKMALRRDPTFRDPNNSKLYKRLLRAQAKMDAGEGFEMEKPIPSESYVVGSDLGQDICDHSRYAKHTNMAGTWASCLDCGFEEPLNKYLRKRHNS